MSLMIIDRIVDAVTQHDPVTYPLNPETRQAAVSVILKPNGLDTEALFILRATQEGDPWSGHMAFPGGHREDHDSHLRETAERETLEEIGLDLRQHGTYVGEIDSVRANPRGRKLDMVVTPHVFLLESEDYSLNPNYEVADILWGGLHGMYTGDSLITREFKVQGEAHKYPGYDVDGQVVWGLTYRMLDQFFGMMDPDWTPHA